MLRYLSGQPDSLFPIQPGFGDRPTVTEDFSDLRIVFTTRDAFLKSAIVKSKVTLIKLSIERSNLMDSLSGVNSTRRNRR